MHPAHNCIIILSLLANKLLPGLFTGKPVDPFFPFFPLILSLSFFLVLPHYSSSVDNFEDLARSRERLHADEGFEMAWLLGARFWQHL